jgi:predicted Zn-dependent protease
MGSGLRQIAKLCDQPAVQTLCSLSLAIHLRNMGKLKEAETVMLTCLKRAPRDLGALVGLGDLYMHAAMPKLAHRLFAGARNAYSGSTIPYTDLAQVALMMGEVDEAIGHLYTLLKSGMIPDKVPGWLARLLYAEGRDEEAEKILNSNRAIWSRMQIAWNTAENANSSVPSSGASNIHVAS